MPEHTSNLSLVPVYEGDGLPFSSRSLKEILRLNPYETLPKIGREWHELPGDPSARLARYIIRRDEEMTFSYGESDECFRSQDDGLEHLVRYSDELLRLRKAGSRLDASQIVAPHAIYADVSNSPRQTARGMATPIRAYFIVPYLGTTEKLSAVPDNPQKHELVLKLGETLLDYYKPNQPAYLVDITTLDQYAPSGVLYDLEAGMLRNGGDIISVHDAIDYLCQWYIPDNPA